MKRGELITLRTFQFMLVLMGAMLVYGLSFATVKLVKGEVHGTAHFEP